MTPPPLWLLLQPVQVQVQAPVGWVLMAMRRAQRGVPRCLVQRCQRLEVEVEVEVEAQWGLLPPGRAARRSTQDAAIVDGREAEEGVQACEWMAAEG